MKKLFLFVIVLSFSMSLSSCSNDDSGSANLSFKINGVRKTFSNAFAVSADGLVAVFATNGPVDDPTESATIAFGEGLTGTEGLISFTYQNADGETYEEDFENFTTNVSVNNGNSLKGVFSGNIIEISSSASATITEGRFSGKVIQGD